MFKTLHKKVNFYTGMLIISLIINILWVSFVNTQPFSDFSYYHELAKEISNGGQWGDTYTSVGYAILLGFFYKIFGSSIIVGKILNLVLTTTSNILLLKILTKINIKENHKKFIFGIFIFFPNNIFYNSILGTELLFTMILLCSVFIYFSNIKYKYVLIGILTGLNTMVKPFFILIFFLIFLVELICTKKLIKPLKHSVIVLFICVLTISPWIYRNTKLVGEFTYVSNNGGIVMYINNNSQNKLGRWMPVEKVENSIINNPDFKTANMTEKNKMFSKAAKKWILSHPYDFMVLGTKRLHNTYFYGDDIYYSLYGTDIPSNISYKMFSVTNFIRNIIFYPAILYIVMYSFFILFNIFKNRSETLDKFTVFLTILFYMFTCVYFITEGQGRYGFPLIFIMCYGFYSIAILSLNILKALIKQIKI